MLLYFTTYAVHTVWGSILQVSNWRCNDEFKEAAKNTHKQSAAVNE